MQCLQCGADQAKENLFCTKCGARMSASQSLLSPAEASKGEALPPSTADEEEEEILRELKEALKSVEPSKDPKPNAETAPQTSNKKLWITGLATTLVAFVAIGLLLFLKSKKEPAASPPASIVELPAQPPTAILTGPDEPARVTVGKMGAVIEAITQYSKTKKGLPSSLTNISRAYADPESIKDGWGQNILYLVDLTNKTYVLRSLGSDGRRDTGDDIAVYSDNVERWLTEQEAIINEWKLANPNSYSQLTLAGPSPEGLKKLEAARKSVEEKKKQQEEAGALKQKKEMEQKRLEAARLEEEKRKQAEAKKHEEELRQAKSREEALRQQQALKRPETVTENFTNGLGEWDAPATWEIVREKELSALRVQGLGFLKKGEHWDNYKVDFEIKVNKESAGWVVRAQNNNFYLFKLGSDKAKAIPKNSLVKYIRADDKYLNSLKREDAPGAAGIIPLSFKVKNKEYYKVSIMIRGNIITHTIDGVQVDTWTDTTFDHGRFGFNASAIEQATIRSFSVEPLR